MENVYKKDNSFLSSDFGNEIKINEKTKEGSISEEALGKYQEEYKEWCSEHNDKSRDFYRKMQGSVSQHSSLMQGEFVETKESDHLDKKEVDEKINDFVEISNNEVSSKDEPIISTKNSSSISKGSNIFYSVVSGVVSGVGYYFTPVQKKPLVRLERTSSEEAFDLVLDLIALENQKPIQILLKQLPESFIKEKLIPLLNELIKLRDEKVMLWTEGKSAPRGNITQYALEFKMEIADLENQLQMAKNLSIKEIISELSTLMNLLMERVETFNTQVLSDFSLFALHSIDSLKDISGPKSRYYNGLKSFIEKNEKNADPILAYLVKNNFTPRSEFVLQSFSWEMEIGKEVGKDRIFEKGYCKIGVAIPGQDLKEIRIPIDFSSFKIATLDEAEILFSILGKIAGASEKQRKEYVKNFKQDFCNYCLMKYFPEKFDGLRFGNVNLSKEEKENLLMVLSSVKSDIEKAIQKGVIIRKSNTIDKQEGFEEINLIDTPEEMLTKEMKIIIEESLKKNLEENNLGHLFEELKGPMMERLVSFDKDFNGLVDKYILNEDNLLNLTKMLLFTCSYADEMIDKVNVTLGNKEFHLDHVVSLFDVFPKLLLEKLSANHPQIKEKYEQLLNKLYELRQGNIENYFYKGEEFKADIEMHKEVSKIYYDLSLLISKSKLSKNETESVFYYLNYVVELSTTDWWDSTLTQLASIQELVKLWSQKLDLPKGFEVDMAQMLSDPSMCRLMADYLNYSKVVEECNRALVKEGITPNENMYHNRRLKHMAFNIVKELLKSPEPLNKKFLINALIDKYKAVVFGHLLEIDKKMNVLFLEKKVDEEDIENLMEAKKYWPKEKDPLVASEHYRIAISSLDLNQLKELFVNQCLELSSFTPTEKTEFEKELRNILMNISNSKIEEFRDLVVLFESLKEQRGEQIFSLNLGLRSIFTEDLGEKFRIILNIAPTEFSGKILQLLIPILENVHTINTQLPYDNKYVYINPPGEISYYQLGDNRHFSNWLVRNQTNDIKNIKNCPESVSCMIKFNYDVRNQSNFIQKVAFHMEEGELIREKFSEEVMLKGEMKKEEIKPSRHPQQGCMELSFSSPTIGDTCSCFIPIDLKPFELKDSETVFQFMTAIHEIGSKEPKDRKNALKERLENGEQIGLKEETKDLFITTVFRYVDMIDEVMNKLLISTAIPEIHFSNVEENGSLIPHQMLLDKCLERTDFKPVLDKYLMALAKVRNQRLESYLKGTIPLINPKDLQEIKNCENNLVYWIAGSSIASGVFKNLEDQQLVVAYIKKMTKFISEPWNEKTDRLLREMNKSIEQVASIEGIDDENRLKKLKEIFIPLLIDPECMKLFNDFIRALKVLIKANSNLEKVTGKEFHNVRMMKKLKNLTMALEKRVDLTHPQKEEIDKWLDKQIEK